RLSFALSSYHNFQYRRGRATGTKECPGLADAYQSIEDAFFQLDPDRFDYGAGLEAKLEEFDDLVEECKKAHQYVQIAYDTIDYVHPVAPVSDDVRTRLAALEQELDRNKNSLAAYLGTRDKIRKLRREVLFSHPALDFDRILINRNPPPSYSHNGDQHLGRHSRVGKGLTILSDWKSDNPRVTTPLEGKLPEGAIRNPDLHFDADKVTFAFCDHTVASSNQRRFFLYEAALDGSWVRQLTGTERDPFETWDNRATVMIEDNDPCYLPDGGLVFISTRSQSFGRCHGGRYNPAWVLYRSDGNGDNIRQLSYNNENEYEPSVLNDGRIVYTRWEYTNRHEMYHHMLWWCRPDGTAVSHYYGNDTLFPMMVVEASAIPGTHKIVATAQGHHSYNTGTTVVLDTNLGENDEEPVTHITPETPYSESSGWPSPHFSHPYAINEQLFLVSRANHRVRPQGQTPPPDDRAIYLVDHLGGRELIYEDLEVASFSPIAIRKRKTPPAMPSLVHENAPPEGTVFVQNAYLTRNDPQRLIQPGMIKALRVIAIGVQPRASRTACSMTVGVEIPKKVLGTVPVGPDGSAFFRAPSGVSLQMQSLDENGMAILTEKSFFYLQPGENRSCTGCHEEVGTVSPASLMAGSGVRRPVELIPAAGPQYKGGLSFMRTVQPVLDRYCIECHGLDKTDGDVDLVHDGQQYPISYRALVERGDHRLGLKGYKTKESTISRPFEYYSHSNKVAHMLIKGHGELGSKLSGDVESFMRIIEWLDVNAQCYGDLFPYKLEERRIDTAALEELRAHVKQQFGEKLASQPERALINVAQPDESRILMAPLARNAGGWGQIDGWKSKNDEGYKKVEALVDACIIRRDNENREGWQPSLESGAGENWVMSAREDYLKMIHGEKEESQ
ncbi:MAG: hypothetical protein V3R99_06960, partial [Thermoguttaceae bacterium]